LEIPSQFATQQLALLEQKIESILQGARGNRLRRGRGKSFVRSSYRGRGLIAHPRGTRLVVLIVEPLADLLAVETPYATDFEAGKFTIFQKSVDGNAMNMEFVGNLGHGPEM
jgi:hypothetical protein